MIYHKNKKLWEEIDTIHKKLEIYKELPQTNEIKVNVSEDYADSLLKFVSVKSTIFIKLKG